MSRLKTSKVITIDYYGEYDGFSEDETQPEPHAGQKVLVYWPDGTASPETLRVKEGQDLPVNADVDTDGPVPTRTFYVLVHYHGKRLEVPLRGMRVHILS